MNRALAFGLLLLAACDRNAGDRDPTIDATPAAITFDGADGREEASKIAHGERLASVLGCRGCHGKELQGKRFYELYASNLTRDLAAYDDKQFGTLLREGVHPTGRDVWAMPSELFQHLSQPDEKALIAYLRTLQPAGPPTGKRLPWEPDAAKMIAEGKLKPAAAFVRETKALGPIDLGSSHSLGRYITRVTCAECHGPELKGGGETPDLIVAGGYSRAEFEKLITEGIPTGGRKLKNELMASVAKSRFSHLTSHERDALYAYLKARSEQPQ
jgi:mono/diheme cytochrome c family protein